MHGQNHIKFLISVFKARVNCEKLMLFKYLMLLFFMVIVKLKLLKLQRAQIWV